MITKHSRKISKLSKGRAEMNMKFERRFFCKPRKSPGNKSSEAIDLAAEKKTVKRVVLSDYLECSSVHGVQYFGSISVKVNKLGKFLWSCTMIIGFVCSTLMVIQFWNRYSDNPANTYVKSFHSPIFNAPFPAISLCPFTHPSYERRRKLLENVQLPANVSYDEAMFILQYADTLMKSYITAREYLDKFQAVLDAFGWRLTDLLQLTRPCNDIVQKCWWHNREFNCTEFITMSHSSKGICCSFNYMLEKYIMDRDTEESQFAYTDRYGAASGLRILFTREILLPENDTHSLSKTDTNSDGVMVSVHHSDDYRGDSIATRIVQANRELQLSVTPKLYKKPLGFSSKDERGYKVPLCIPNEKGLKYFPKYRYSNCYANCRVEAMLRICGCLPYNYAPLTKKHGIKNCGLAGLDCQSVNSHHFRFIKNVYTDNFTCSCRHPCDNVVYDVTPLDVSIRPENSPLSPFYHSVGKGQGVLRVYWSSQTYMILEAIPTDEIYLLASIGGIFSLFLGCSFISAFEIMYFMGLLCRKRFSRRKANSVSQKRQLHLNMFRSTKLYE